jgi:mono/diheme cytochrome c family protein
MQDNYNRGGFIAFIGSVVFSLAFMAYVALMHKGIDLKEVQANQAAATQAASGSASTEPADADVSKVEKPWVSSPEMIAHGRKVFLNNCAMCHGQQGLGDGPAGQSLNPRPRNFVEGKWKQGGRTQDLFKTLLTGVPGSSMVSFKALPKNDRWSLVHYIRSITHNKVQDDPKQLEAFAKTAE